MKFILWYPFFWWHIAIFQDWIILQLFIKTLIIKITIILITGSCTFLSFQQNLFFILLNFSNIPLSYRDIFLKTIIIPNCAKRFCF